jgi:hydroxymethylpyrimidine pyrophosphatase-like HAD family hydrolase
MLVLVTGRELPDLFDLFPEIGLFKLVIAENGAVLFEPATGFSKILCQPPPSSFIPALRGRQVEPLSQGKVIVSTRKEHAVACADVIDELNLQLQFILNKESLMILPSGVDKRSGFQHALAHLSISAEQVVGVGDAENDLSFLSACGLAVAVANALPEIKSQVDYCTKGPAGDGVEELIHKLLADDLES